MRDAPRSLTPRSLTCCRVLSRSLAFGASLPPACSLARGSTCTHVASSNDDVAVPVLLWLPRTISAGAPSLMHHTLHATDLRHLVQISRSPLLISATDLRHLNLAVQPPMTSHRRRSLYTQTRAPDHRGTQPRVSHEHRTIGTTASLLVGCYQRTANMADGERLSMHYVPGGRSMERFHEIERHPAPRRIPCAGSLPLGLGRGRMLGLQRPGCPARTFVVESIF